MFAHLNTALEEDAFPGVWTEQAVCRGEAPLVFSQHSDKARQICANCPVQYVTTIGKWGIWGDLDREQCHTLANSQDPSTNRPEKCRASA